VRRSRPPDLRRLLAKNLRRVRADRGLTQESAAALVGINPRHYQKLEEGSVNVTFRTLQRLCSGLVVDPRDFFAP
jgi:transcriptional regulator with XRE-family HTH domain